MTLNKSEKIIVAFDVSSKSDFLKLCNDLKNEAKYIKIGMECFYSLGGESVKMAKEAGLKVFLDLKLHDIPNTVEKSVYTLSKLGADMINVHALGGLEMMKAARRAVDRGVKDFSLPSPPLLIAVTHLTSLDQDNLTNEIGIQKDLRDSALDLAKLAQEAGLDGVVCSAHEAKTIKEKCGEGFKTITPGIRLEESSSHDQKRIMTPKQAAASGADFLVIGRSITAAKAPAEKLKLALEEIQ